MKLLSKSAAVTALGLVVSVAVATPALAVDPPTITPNEAEGTVTIVSTGADRFFFCAAGTSRDLCDSDEDADVLYYYFPGGAADRTLGVGSEIWIFGPPWPRTLGPGVFLINNRDTFRDNVEIFDPTPDPTSGGDTTPGPILQAVHVPATGACSDVPAGAYGFQDTFTGGWGMSWAEWANGGTGGAVCVRTLTYSTSMGAWTVQQ